MSGLVDVVRRVNLACPWPRLKPWLARRVEGRLPTDGGSQVYEGIDGGMKFHLDLQRRAHRMIYLNAYQVNITGLIKRLLRPGDVYVDVGASIGYFVAVAARCVGPAGRVYAYEPQPYHCQILERNISANALGNVTVRPVACWSSAGTAELHNFEGTRPTHASLGLRPDKSVATTMTVPTVRIDDEITPPVRLIKIDVEGAEREMLRGAQRLVSTKPRPHLILELNPKTAAGFGYDTLEVVDWLGQFGRYRMRLLRSRRAVPVTREELAAMFQADPMRTCNVHLEPCD